MRLAPLFFTLMLAVALQGCGIRGPLYLPDQPSAKKKVEPPSAQDQEQK